MNARIQILGVLVATTLAACDRPSSSCPGLVGETLAQGRNCQPPADKWLEAGAHDRGGKVYSVVWRDYAVGENQSITNWVPDDKWNRALFVVEHLSGDPGAARPDDPIVYQATLYCEVQNHLFGGHDRVTSVLESYGTQPLPTPELGCGDWPSWLDAPASEQVAEPCYAAHLCPLGTLCAPIAVGDECPPAASICVPPAQIAGYTTAAINGELVTAQDVCQQTVYDLADHSCATLDVLCYDGKPCTADTCDVAQGGCVQEIVDGCFIDGVCVDSYAANPQNPAELCVPGATAWSGPPDADGDGVPDAGAGSPCTGGATTS